MPTCAIAWGGREWWLGWAGGGLVWDSDMAPARRIDASCPEVDGRFSYFLQELRDVNGQPVITERKLPGVFLFAWLRRLPTPGSSRRFSAALTPPRHTGLMSFGLWWVERWTSSSPHNHKVLIFARNAQILLEDVHLHLAKYIDMHHRFGTNVSIIFIRANLKYIELKLLLLWG